MTKLAVHGQTLLAGIAVLAEVNELHSATATTSAKRIRTPSGSKTTSPNVVAVESNININSNSNNIILEGRERTKPETFHDPELLEYFTSSSGAETKDNEGYRSGPLSYPVYFIQKSISKLSEDTDTDTTSQQNANSDSDSDSDPSNTGQQKQNEGLFPRLYRRLFDDMFPTISDNGNSRVDDNQYIYGYTNYDREEIKEHEEKLITDDDQMISDSDSNMQVLDDDPPSFYIPTRPTAAPFPTTAPTPLDSSFWDVLDTYHTKGVDDHVSVDDWMPDTSASKEITETDILMDRAENSIVLRLALGVVNFEAMTKDDQLDVLGMAIRAMSVVLNKEYDLPFIVIDSLSDRDRNRNRERNRNLREKDDSSSSSWRRSPSHSHGDQHHPQSHPHPQLRSAGISLDLSMKDLEEEYLAKLFLEHAVVEYSQENWWEVSAIYSVWKNPLLRQNSMTSNRDDDNGTRDLREESARPMPVEEQRRRRQGYMSPVKGRNILKKIEGICDHAIAESIEEEVYWETLKLINYGNQDLLMTKKKYYTDDKGMVDVKSVGDEYDLSPMFCPYSRPMDDDSLAMDCSATPSPQSYSTATYPYPIANSLSEIQWNIREWFGLGLMISTVLWAVLLPLIALSVKQKRKRQYVWGAPLTPTGVDDILNVGWRVYEQSNEGQALGEQQAHGDPYDYDIQQQQQQQQQQFQQQQQLFLQIYDKGGQGYNDENSMLRGGVEQQMFAPPTAAALAPPTSEPAQTVSTATGTNNANEM